MNHMNLIRFLSFSSEPLRKRTECIIKRHISCSVESHKVTSMMRMGKLRREGTRDTSCHSHVQMRWVFFSFLSHVKLKLESTWRDISHRWWWRNHWIYEKVLRNFLVLIKCLICDTMTFWACINDVCSVVCMYLRIYQNTDDIFF